MRRIIPLGAFVAVAVLGVALPALAGGLAQVSTPVADTGPGVALFEGRLIDLANGWGDAQAGVVWRAAGEEECFRSADDMAVREAPPLAQPPSVPTGARSAPARPSGSSPLRLYTPNDLAVRQLSFWDAGFWQNLTDYGFNDQLSSYVIGSCYAHLAEHIWGGGAWYPGGTGPFDVAYSMASGWNDRVSSIYNE